MKKLSGSDVLVVDDNSANTLVLKAMVERYGVHVDTAESGMEAIEKTCSKSYDFVLMDYLMPDMDGVEAIRQIKFVTSGTDGTVFFGVSATVDAQVKELFDKAGATDVLRKPVKKEELEAALIANGFEIDVTESEEQEDEDQTMFLSSVDGLNYEEGLSLMAGSLENYMKVLVVSVRNIIENYNMIDVIRNTEQMETMTLHFHSLKGIFLNIGADELAEQSKRLEFAAREFENSYVHEMMDGYLEKVKKFHDQLEKACIFFKEQDKNKSNSEVMPVSEFMKNVEKLKEYIQDFNYIDIIEMLEKMMGSASADRQEILNKVYDNIQNFEYDAAYEILNNITEN